MNNWINVKNDLLNLESDTIESGKTRRPGGGREKNINSLPETEADLKNCLSDYTAGCPQNEPVKYTHLNPLQIAEKLFAKGYEKVSTYLTRQWLKLFGFRKRSIHRSLLLGQTLLRDEQFNYIRLLKKLFLKRGLPVLSIDTKKKEILGMFYRKGSSFSIRFMTMISLLIQKVK